MHMKLAVNIQILVEASEGTISAFLVGPMNIKPAFELEM